MSDYRVMAALGSRSGLEEDRMVNVWHVRTPAEVGPGNAATAQELVFRYASFYQDISSILSIVSLRETVGAHVMKVYSLLKGAPGAADDVAVLLVDDTFSTPNISQTSEAHVAEAALCLSMLASPQQVPEFQGIARPRSRRRGRAYIGGLNSTNAMSQSVNGGKRPTLAARDVILDAAVTLKTSLAAVPLASAEMAVYSRTDGQMRPVTEIYVDDAYDTIRSRGLAPTTRTTRIF